MASTVLAQGTVEIEPNDSAATATALALGAQAYGDITTGVLDDWDYFAITLTAPTDLRAWTAPGFTGQIGDTRLALTDAVGNVLAEVDDGSTATHGYYSILTVGDLAPGNYCLRVRGYDPSTLGSYTLDVVAAPRGTYAPVYTLSPISEHAEPNDPRQSFGVNTISAPFTRNSGTTSGGGVDGAGFAIGGADYDFYRVIVPTPGLYTFSTLATPLTASAPLVDDTVVFLAIATPPGYTAIASNDDFNGGPYSQFTYDITVAGTYYVAVKGYFGTSIGNYVLDIVGPTAPLPTGPTSVTIHGGGCAGSAGTPTLGVRPSTFGFTVAPEKPLLGTTWTIDLANVPANAPIIRCIGLVVVSPLDLTPFGAPGCIIEPTDVTDFGIAEPGGYFWWQVPLPMTLSLTGLPLEQQVVVLDPAANAAGVSVSNRVACVGGLAH
ncbi:MAG: hypothetical protein IPK26_01995 [Planctomycetes bacterium]|nr:hypothetical protein [Planctomycetota bacterium]